LDHRSNWVKIKEAPPTLSVKKEDPPPFYLKP
jgi:hypothetical protein